MRLPGTPTALVAALLLSLSSAAALAAPSGTDPAAGDTSPASPDKSPPGRDKDQGKDQDQDKDKDKGRPDPNAHPGAGPGRETTPPAPVLADSVTAQPARGVVRVKHPRSSDFAPLEGGASVPVGSLVDASAGAVRLTAASDADGGTTESATFSGAAFEVRQERSSRPVTELVLHGGDFSRCARDPEQPVASAAAGRGNKPVRRLWGEGKGRFRTRGRHSAASVRGTMWLTEDGCNGTRTRVKHGVVEVRDFVRGRTVVLTAGQRVFVRAPR